MNLSLLSLFVSVCKLHLIWLLQSTFSVGACGFYFNVYKRKGDNLKEYRNNNF